MRAASSSSPWREIGRCVRLHQAGAFKRESAKIQGVKRLGAADGPVVAIVTRWPICAPKTGELSRRAS